MIDLADLPSDWAVWSIDQPVEGLEFRRWLSEMTASPLPVASSAPPKRRIRRPSLESTVRQMLKAAQAAGVPIALTVEGDKVVATPMRGIAPAPTLGEPATDEVEAWIRKQQESHAH